MNSPLTADENGVNLKPDKMEKEKLYHCIFKNKVILVFKDSQNMLNCYEIEEEKLVEQIKKSIDDSELEKIFEDYLIGENITN
jgi:Zn-dependent M16 (insulinase) family peptidase